MKIISDVFPYSVLQQLSVTDVLIMNLLMIGFNYTMETWPLFRFKYSNCDKLERTGSVLMQGMW